MSLSSYPLPLSTYGGLRGLIRIIFRGKKRVKCHMSLFHLCVIFPPLFHFLVLFFVFSSFRFRSLAFTLRFPFSYVCSFIFFISFSISAIYSSLSLFHCLSFILFNLFMTSPLFRLCYFSFSCLVWFCFLHKPIYQVSFLQRSLIKNLARTKNNNNSNNTNRNNNNNNNKIIVTCNLCNCLPVSLATRDEGLCRRGIS